MAIIKENAKILHLTLKKKWFDLIASGKKKEEYREVKPFFVKRFIKSMGDSSVIYTIPFRTGDGFEWKEYDWVAFKNGYSKDAPLIYVEFLGFEVREGKEEWGAEKGQRYFVLKLGEILHTQFL